MKNIINALIVAAVTLSGGLASAETWIVDDITENTTWNLAGSPYHVYGQIQIIGAVLTINPGVDVILEGHPNEYTCLLITDVGGRIVAHGTAADSVDFWANGNYVGGLASQHWGVDIVDPPVYDFDFEHCTFYQIWYIGFEYAAAPGNGGIRAVDCSFLETAVRDPSFLTPLYQSRFERCYFSGDPIHPGVDRALGVEWGLVDDCTFTECPRGCWIAKGEILDSLFEYCGYGLTLNMGEIYTTGNTFDHNDFGLTGFSPSWISESDTFTWNTTGADVGCWVPVQDYALMTGATFTHNAVGIHGDGTAKGLKIRNSVFHNNRKQALYLQCDHACFDLGTPDDPGGNDLYWNGDNDPDTDECDIYSPGWLVPGIIPAVGNSWEWPWESLIELYGIVDANDRPECLLDVRVTEDDTYVLHRQVSFDAAVRAPESMSVVTTDNGTDSACSVDAGTGGGNNSNIKPTSLGRIKAQFK